MLEATNHSQCYFSPLFTFSVLKNRHCYRNRLRETTERMPTCRNVQIHICLYTYFFFYHKSNVYRCIPGRNRECMTLSYAESGQWCIQGHPAYSERQGLSPVLGGGFSQHLFSDPFIWRCLGQNLGLPACKTDARPLKYGFLPPRGSLK